MANNDSPNGFKCVHSPTGPRKYTAGGTFAKGDWVYLDATTGTVLIATASTTEVLGVAATAGASGEDCQVWDHPQAVFVGQTSGSYATTNDGDLVDIEGTTGIQEVNEDANVVGLLRILKHYPIGGSEDTGANARVAVKAVRHQLGANPGNTEGSQTFENVIATTAVETDTIQEHTPAAGVTVDSVLLKDGSVSAADAGSVSTNTISEKTAASGVTVDGVKCKDSELILGAAALTGDTSKLRVGVADANPANGAGYGSGSLFVSLVGGVPTLHINVGTDAAVNWVVVGTQA